MGAAHPVGPGRRRHDARHERRSARSARSRCSPTGPIASRAGEVPPAPPRPQGLERNVVITEWDWADPKAYLHDEVSTDRRNPRLNAERPDLRFARTERRLPAGARSRCTTPSASVPLTVRDPKTPPTLARRCRSRRRTGATRRSGPARTTSTTRCSTSRDASGSPRRSVRRRNPDFCKAGSTHPSAKLFPLEQLGRQLADVRPEDEEADAHQHVLRHASPDVRGGREQHAVDERRRRRSSAG